MLVFLAFYYITTIAHKNALAILNHLCFSVPLEEINRDSKIGRKQIRNCLNYRIIGWDMKDVHDLFSKMPLCELDGWMYSKDRHSKNKIIEFWICKPSPILGKYHGPIEMNIFYDNSKKVRAVSN